MRRTASILAVSGLALAGIAAAPHDAKAWWRGGYGVVFPPVVVAPPVYAPPPVYVPPRVAYAPPPYYYGPHRVWVAPHWDGPYWVRGHWA